MAKKTALPDTPINLWPRYYSPLAAAVVSLDEREAEAEAEAEP
jgi:hypothetical protein